MINAITGSLLGDNVRILQSEVSKTAYQGVFIAIATVIIATFMATFFSTGELSLDGILFSQKTNMVLWILDCTPFAFGLWGQYASSIIAHKAGIIIFDQTQQLRLKADNLEKQSNFISTHDPLTELPNRSLFYDRVERAIVSANAQNQFLSILLIDIENYKDIYDTLGRNSSDLVIKQIASRLKGVSRERDSIAKIDGNVFGILMANIADLTGAEKFAQFIQKSLELPFVVEKLTIAIHSTVGIVHFPEHGQDVDTLVQKAGVAMHMAQSSNCGYAVYTSRFDSHSPHRLTLMSELRHAMELGGLELYYQAKISIQTEKVYGAEALLRWNHPVHGFISPDEFIPMAERNRMITQLTHWVLKQAFRDCAEWRKRGFELIISVNLSAKDLHDPELPDLIAGAAVSAAIKPEWIMLEITEGTVMTDPESALAVIERLHCMGFQFSIDDFGTGYSSLAYLKKMPLTELKIDKSFVIDILKNENDATIVKTTINMAHTLGLQVIAEGVESEDILIKLKDYSCDFAQGYYINKPLSVMDFNNWINHSKWQVSHAVSQS